MTAVGKDALNTRKTLEVKGKAYDYYSIKAAESSGLGDVSRLPFSLKVLLENLLRFEDDGATVSIDDIKALGQWQEKRQSSREIQYRPARVLMQDFTGVPAVVDLAAMRDAVAKAGANPTAINPLSPVDLVIDHSVMVDAYANSNAFKANVDIEMERNRERYEFLRWGQKAFENFRVVPPGTGICHQVNLEYLAKAVWTSENDGRTIAYPDTLVGTDSHTTMVNGLGVLGWGVGGIEAEAAMLGQPISMLIPEVVGFKLTGKLKEGITATDLVLTVVQMLRQQGVVGKFVEFYGPGLNDLPLADRATIANMAPEYGATCGFFPVDKETINYLELSGREEETIALVEAYAKAQGMWRDENTADPVFTATLELDLNSVVPSLAGPKRPQDRVELPKLPTAFDQLVADQGKADELDKAVAVEGNGNYELSHGDVVIAAITSCTNTSNPSVLMAAGLVAKKALEKGLIRQPWVKSSLAPGSKVVTEYLENAGLQTYLDQLGFNLVGYGCTTCIGNSGPLLPEIEKAIADHDLTVSAVLSGNRNFEGRVHPFVKANWLASPPLVVAYALAGTTRKNLEVEPIGQDKNGNDVYLRDIWPSNSEVAAEVAKVSRAMFQKEYAEVFAGDENWQNIPVAEGQTYKWNSESTYVQSPPFFEGLDKPVAAVEDIKGARPLAILGDSVTTDHISPAGVIKVDSPAGAYLKSHGVDNKDFNSYGSRRGNHEVMMRGTFANIRIRNEMVPGVEGGYTRHIAGEQLSIYDAAMKYQSEGTPLVVIGGKEYGTGSSRDWAAKGTRLLGVKAVITESFERIHRSNLIGMGVLPLQFKNGQDRNSLKLDGTETFDITGLNSLQAGQDISAVIHRQDDGSSENITLLCRIDTANEVEYYRTGGILHYVLRNMMKNG
ncbi:Aconitate hydratase 1 [Piscirickettsia salmonis]|uniref:Aconitate hydratase n=1 Tax=Piscirickettsia salmonis TaxID=1238 RepID=A0A1L6TEB8_PISSA|nr:aconitate hydratase AcnA [Piscirickettsia salmonis]AKP72727.1 aconitate hydratase [Piscirickettsia salmonis LF-89 = ATCC VR-1361]ALB23769.1 aconitate hydratase 1 [Piscirickettsia salmonis]ALY03616.1 aconitate hydratase [Piscirickettsia salmonis]AMA43180.1 aconitate hydratase [Piscirickettsia salmonis]AOS35652.1 aconitate hydratase [Piscirickettsia salmonis]